MEHIPYDGSINQPTSRVYVVELEEDDVLYATHETVAYVERITDHRTLVYMTSGHVTAFNRGDSTILIYDVGNDDYAD